MASEKSMAMSSYELPLPESGLPAGGAAGGGGAESLTEPLLVHNVRWFCRFRWMVIGVLSAFGVVGMFPEAVRFFGLRPPGTWPFVTAGVLVLGNLVFLRHARLSNSTRVNLWGQIVLDLLVLTVVVHFVGSVETYISFAYLFHIVLACVFFSPSRSLAVTLLATLLFGACIAAEHAGIIEPVGLFAETSVREHIARMPGALVVNSVSAVVIWLVVWYLASHLSMMVRQRDRELAETNRRLVAAQAERARHMLTTTHQLKAPFAAIHANAQLLLKGHCGALSSAATDAARRIAARCGRLASEIQDMLQLANLRSVSQRPPARVELDVAELLRSCLEQVRLPAQERRVVLDADLQAARTTGVEEHLKMLLANLLSNAVAYSHESGRVRVRCRPAGRAGPVVTIADEGIGIPAEKLPRIFEEHYRTNEAVRHNKESSGLGLAIVRQVAERHGIRLRVESRSGAGTTFELQFPPARVSPDASAAKETQDGLCDDCG